MPKPITGKNHIGERREKRQNGDIYVYERITAYNSNSKRNWKTGLPSTLSPRSWFGSTASKPQRYRLSWAAIDISGQRQTVFEVLGCSHKIVYALSDFQDNIDCS